MRAPTRAVVGVIVIALAIGPGCTDGDSDEVRAAVTPGPVEACLREQLKSMRHAVRVAHDGLENTLPDVRALFDQALSGVKKVPGGTGSKFPIRSVFGTIFDTLKGNRATLRDTLREAEPC
jgi:hypothetical protein